MTDSRFVGEYSKAGHEDVTTEERNLIKSTNEKQKKKQDERSKK